jgi:HK97 family phage major capsid protein
MFVQLKSPFQSQPVGARIDVSDADGQLLIKSGIAEAVAGDPLGDAFARRTAALIDGLAKSTQAAINEALLRFQHEASQSRRLAVPAIFGPGGDGDPKKNFADWLLCVARAGSRKASVAVPAQERLEKAYGSMFSHWSEQTKAAMGEASGVTGGYIVPPDFYYGLLQVAAEVATFRALAFVQPMASATLQFPYLDITTVQAAGTSPFFGGVIANWTAEAQTRTETEPQFKMMELKAQELSGYSVSSNVLLQDAAFGLEKFLMTLFGLAVAWYEEFAFLQGNGVGKPLGVLSAGATIAVNRTTPGHFSFADFATMESKLLPASYNRAEFWISPTVITDLYQLKDGAGRALFITTEMGGVTARPKRTLGGRVVNITEKVPALGTKGDVMLIDPSLYVIGDRMMLEIAASEHVNFLKNQMTWRFVQRVDGRPWLDSYITLQDTTSTVSPFVALS